MLGSEPRTKAYFEVHEVASTLYGESKVLAIVQFPESALGDLEGKVGETLAFEGRLLQVDGFMRSIYLADGRLTA